MHALRNLSLCALALAAVGSAACNDYLGNINEGLNIHNMGGKVVIPKTALGTSSLGVVYVGIWSGVDNRLGYLSPDAAPAQVGNGNTFPYGGTSIGDYYTRDARYTCLNVTDQTVVDAGANLELPFEILQFPLYPGAAVWAFADNDASSCNAGGGFYDAFAIFVTPLTVTPSGANFTVKVAPTDISSFAGIGSDEKQFLDPAGRLYRLVGAVNTSSNTFSVTDVFNYGVPPSTEGHFASQLLKPTSFTYYGTQYQDVLNFPSTYVTPGDLVPSTPTLIMDTTPVTLTLDTKVN